MVAESGYGHAVADDVGADALVRRDPAMGRDMELTRRDSQVRRAPNSAGLYDVLDLILDKGIVIDAFVRVSLVGIELLTVDLRVVIASVDTYLRYAEGAERLQLYNRAGSKRLPDMVGGGMKGHALKKGAEKVERGLEHSFGGKGDDEDDDRHGHDGGGLTGTLTRGVRNVVGRLVGSGHDDDDDRNNDDDRDERENRRQPEQRSRENGGGGERQARHARHGNGAGRQAAGARR